MPIKKYRSVDEMDGNTWREPESEELYRAIERVWSFAARTLQPTYPPGVHKHRSIEEAQRQKEAWGQANFKAYQARQAAARKSPGAPPVVSAPNEPPPEPKR